MFDLERLRDKIISVWWVFFKERKVVNISFFRERVVFICVL